MPALMRLRAIGAPMCCLMILLLSGRPAAGADRGASAVVAEPASPSPARSAEEPTPPSPRPSTLPAEAATTAPAAPPEHLLIGGTEELLWVGQGRWDAELRTWLYRFAWQDKTGPRLRPATHIRPQLGRMVRWAAAGPRLHVFYGADERFPQGGAHFSYRPAEAGSEGEDLRRELPLPGGAIPAALAGDPLGPRPLLWAVVDARTAEAVAEDWKELNGDALPPATATAEAPPVAEEVPARQEVGDEYHIVAYDGFAWQPRFPVAGHCRSVEQLWLCAGNGQLYLFWLPRAGDLSVHFAHHREGQWALGPSVPLDHPIEQAFALLLNRQLYFVGLRRDDLDVYRRRVVIWNWYAGEDGTGSWRPGPALREAEVRDDLPLLLPAGSTLGAFIDQLVILRPGPSGPEVAMYSAVQGGPPLIPFRAVPLAEGPPASRAERGMRDLIATIAVAAVLLLIFWRRQEAIAAPIPLPAGLVVAGPGRRAAAALLDMLPAAAVVLLGWNLLLSRSSGEIEKELNAWWQAMTSTDTGTPAEDIVWPAALAWAWLAFRLVYAGYCTIFELLWHSTPGKRLLHCEIRQETLEGPLTAQILIRNLTRLIELEPYLQVWPFLLVIVFTRNHQRVGDLLARTIVVERQRVVPTTDASDRSSTDETG